MEQTTNLKWLYCRISEPSTVTTGSLTAILYSQKINWSQQAVRDSYLPIPRHLSVCCWTSQGNPHQKWAFSESSQTSCFRGLTKHPQAKSKGEGIWKTKFFWFGCFQKNWYPKMDGENHGNPYQKWMIWGYPYFWKHPFVFFVFFFPRHLKDISNLFRASPPQTNDVHFWKLLARKIWRSPWNIALSFGCYPVCRSSQQHWASEW